MMDIGLSMMAAKDLVLFPDVLGTKPPPQNQQMGRIDMSGYGKIVLLPRIEADHGRDFNTPASLSLDVSKGLSFWEDFDATERCAGVVVDTANTPTLELKDIPTVIEFLQQVLKRQVP